jgi:hypothetical protein
MKYSEKDKDKVLAAFCEESPINFDSDIVSILSADGYVETLTSPNGRLTRVTDKGRAFYFAGGYSGAKKKERSKVIGDSVRSVIAAVIGSVLTILIEHVLLPWLASLR